MNLAKSSLFAVALLVAAGCNKKGGDASQAEPPSDLSVSRAAAQKLADVNCISIDNKVTCDPVDGLQAMQSFDSKTQELVFDQNGIKKQLKTMEDYIAAIQADLGSAAVNATDKTSLSELYTSAVNCDLELQKRLEKNRTAQMNEISFNEVFGFNCAGSYMAAGAPTKFMQYMDSTDRGTDVNQAYGSTNDVDLTSHLKYTKSDRSVSWSSEQSTSGAKRDLKTVVSSDGEFTLKTSDSSKLNMSCLRLRAFGTSTSLSDEPIKNRKMRCVSSSIQALQTGEKEAKSSTWSMEFTAVADGDERVIQLNTPDDFVLDAMGFRPKFAAELQMLKGILNFRVIDSASSQEVMKVQSANSVPNLTFALKNAAGDSVMVTCGEKVPDIYNHSDK